MATSRRSPIPVQHLIRRDQAPHSGIEQLGFTLVELMIVVAITAILTSVAIPAYINYVNRSKQSVAITALMQAKMEQEMYWANTSSYTYASDIHSLPSFSNNHVNGYTVSVVSADTNSYVMRAEHKYYTWAATDIIEVSSSTSHPSIVTGDPDPLRFSVFKWIFN